MFSVATQSLASFRIIATKYYGSMYRKLALLFFKGYPTMEQILFQSMLILFLTYTIGIGALIEIARLSIRAYNVKANDITILYFNMCALFKSIKIKHHLVYKYDVVYFLIHHRNSEFTSLIRHLFLVLILWISHWS